MTDNPRLSYPLREWCALNKIGILTAYEWIKAGKLRININLGQARLRAY